MCLLIQHHCFYGTILQYNLLFFQRLLHG
jgi:hypothetical protein